MIRTNEIRIGNHVGFSISNKKEDVSGKGIVTAINETDVRLNDVVFPFKSIRPISLNPEILQQCGFKKHNNAWVPLDYNEKDYNRWRFTIWDQFDGEDLRYNSAEFQISLTSVHQLQNLYFSLTGEELSINFKELTPH